jgi:hypothetical protein
MEVAGVAPARAKALAADATENVAIQDGLGENHCVVPATKSLRCSRNAVAVSLFHSAMVLGKIIALFPECCRGLAVLYGC